MQPQKTRKRNRRWTHNPYAAEACCQLEQLEPRLLLAADGGPVLWSEIDGGNGHSYQVVVVNGGISWQDAKLAAENMGGHLATITSAQENTFVADLIDHSDYWFQLPTLGLHSWGPWIGAYRDPDAGPITEGWAWVTGEEFDYTNWITGTPDRIEENFGYYMTSNAYTGDTWNNWVNDSNRFAIISYIVEFEPEIVLNNAPTITSDAQAEAGYDTYTFEHLITAVDDDHDALQFTAANLPDWLELIDNGDGTALLSGTPLYEHIGSYEITVTVSDGRAVTEQIITFSIDSVGEISGTLWDDTNGNGLYDDNEESLVGWTVYLDANENSQLDDGEIFTTTDENGNYLFTGVQPGEHLLSVVMQDGGNQVDLSNYYLKSSRLFGLIRDYVSFADTEKMQRTDINDTTFLIGYEGGDDHHFDELVMKFTMTDDGYDMEVLSREWFSTYQLHDSNGNVLVSNLAGFFFHGHRNVQFNAQWNVTYVEPQQNPDSDVTPPAPQPSHAVRIITTKGSLVTDINFGMQNSTSIEMDLERCGFKRIFEFHGWGKTGKNKVHFANLLLKLLHGEHTGWNKC